MTADAAPRPHLRVRVSREGGAEMRALARSALAHAAFLLALVVGDWLQRVPWRQPRTTRVGLVASAALPAPPRAAAPARPSVARPSPPTVAPPLPPAAAEPEPPRPAEPEPELPGIAPPPVEASASRKPPPRKPPERRPRPTASSPVATAAAAGPSPASAAGVAALGIAATVDGWEGGPGDPYLEGIVRRVSGKWLKPRTGLPPRSATVYFEIDRSGRVLALGLETPSGSGLFDRAAVRAVELAAPMPPLPAGVRSEQLKVHFDFLP